MRSFHGTSSLVAGGIALALLTGCSGGNIAGPTVGGAIGPAAIGTETLSRPSAPLSFSLPRMPTHGTGVVVHPFINFAAMARNKGPTIAISVPQQNAVDLFTTTGMQVGQLTGFSFPSGMASDIKGDLYVADYGNSRVQIYAAGFANPPTTLSDAGQAPSDVDSFGNGAYVAVANVFSSEQAAPGNVSIFKGSTLQSNINLSNLKFPYYCAFDGKGNLYVDGVDANHNVVLGEIPHATSGGSTFEQLTTTNTFGEATGIQVTTAGGRIAIADALNQAIYTYNPPSGGSLGAPTQITPLVGSQYPQGFAFTKNMTNLYVADQSYNAFEFAYPAGGAPVSAIAVGGGAFGMAVIPTQYPGSSR